MRQGLRGALAIPMVFLAAPALAGDFYAPVPVSGYSWAGAYIGLNAGYAWGRATHVDAHPSGIAGGAQAGYNWQTGPFVIGGETDLQVSGAEDTFAAWKFSNPWFGSVRGRAGFAMNNILFYATAGLAYGGLHVEVGRASEEQHHLGWAAGAGMEVGLTPRWSARAEYIFTDLSDRGYVLTGSDTGVETNQLRLGVNYRF